MKYTQITSLLAAALFSASAAHAGGGALLGGNSTANEGSFYVGASAGQISETEAECDSECDTNGYKVYGGYHFTDMLAVEGGYYNLGSVEEQNVDIKSELTAAGQTVNTAIADFESGASAIAAMGVVKIPLMDKLEVFGKVGMVKAENEVTVDNIRVDGQKTNGTQTKTFDGTGPIYGVGVGYKISDNFGIRAEVEQSKVEFDDLELEVKSNMYSIGATYSTL